MMVWDLVDLKSEKENYCSSVVESKLHLPTFSTTMSLMVSHYIQCIYVIPLITKLLKYVFATSE